MDFADLRRLYAHGYYGLHRFTRIVLMDNDILSVNTKNPPLPPFKKGGDVVVPFTKGDDDG